MSSSKKVTLVNYDTSWPQQFQQAQINIKQHMKELAVSIEHIGSTSVPGLMAKDIIDIQVTVDDLEDPLIVKRLKQAKLVHRPDVTSDNLTGFDGNPMELSKLYFTQPPESKVKLHVHVRQSGRINQEYPILFRQFLTENQDIRAAYQSFKQILAEKLADNKELYAQLKDPYMDIIYRCAKQQ